MRIPTVTETPGTPVPPVSALASGGVAPAKVQEDATTQTVAPVAAPPPPPPPVTGFDQEVLVGIDEATNRKVYDIVEPDTGDEIVQIPAEAVLSLVAKILQQLEAEGLR